MAPVTEDDQARVKALLTEAVTVLCKDGLRHTSQLSIEGLLGITIDRQDILLVNINQTVYADNKKDGRKGKGGKRAAQGTAAQGKKNKPPKPKRRRKGDQQVPPLVLQPNLGHLSIKQEVEQNYPGYNDQLPIGYDEADYSGAPPKKATPKKKKKRAPPPQVQDVMLSEETMVGVQRTIIEQEGCVALSRILQRRKNKFRASVLIHAMREMSRSQSDRHYVGEYKEIGNIKIFYKCPPELLHADALVDYSITHQEYTNLFYHDFKPNSGCPTDWGSYVATLMANTPYNPMLFPIDSMGCTEDEKKMLANKQLERQRVFQQAVNNTDSEDHDDIEDHMVMGVEQEVEEDLSEEVIDTPGVALSLTIPASGSAEAVVGHLGHVIHVPQTVHGVHMHDTIEDHVGCHETIETDDCAETIETETVIEDSLVMHDEQDYDSPS